MKRNGSKTLIKIDKRKKVSPLFLLDKSVLKVLQPIDDISTAQFWRELKKLLSNNNDWNYLKFSCANGNNKEITREVINEYSKLKLVVEPRELLALISTVDIGTVKLINKNELLAPHCVAALGDVDLLKKHLTSNNRLNLVCIKNNDFKRFAPITIAFFLNKKAAFLWLLEQGVSLESFTQLDVFEDCYDINQEFTALLIKHGVLELQSKKNFLGRTSIHEAAKHGDINFIKFLMEAGAAVDILTRVVINTGPTEVTPLEMAVNNNQWSVVQYLLENGARVHLDIVLTTLVRENKIDRISSVLEKYPKNNLEDYDCFEDLIKIAINAKNRQMILLLAKHFGKIPVTVACAIFVKNTNARSALIVFLLQNNLIDLNKKTNSRTSLFHVLIKYQSTERLNVILENLILKDIVDLNITDECGMTPIHIAASQGNKWLLQRLLNDGADLNAQTPTQITALHIAAYRGFADIVKILIAYGANVDIADYNNYLALHMTLASSLNVGSDMRADCARLLLAAGSNYLSNQSVVYEDIMQGGKLLAMEEEKIDAAVKSACEERLLISLCSHIFNIGGYVSLKHKKNDGWSKIRLEGMSNDAWLMRNAINSLKEAVEQYGNIFNKANIENIIDVCEFSISRHAKTNNDFLERIKSGKATSFHGGEFCHSEQFAILRNLIIVCNAGLGVRGQKAIEVFEFNPEKLTTEMIADIRHANLENIEYFTYLLKVLEKDLEFTKNNFTNEMLRRCCLPLQDIGNCVYRSFEASLWVLYMLFPYMSANKFPTEYIDKGIDDFNERKCESLILLMKLNFTEQLLDFYLYEKSDNYPDSKKFSNMFDKLRDEEINENHLFYSKYKDLLSSYEKLKKLFSAQESQTILPAKANFRQDELVQAEREKPTWPNIKDNYFTFYPPIKNSPGSQDKISGDMFSKQYSAETKVNTCRL